jgi:hypothetical protein
MVKIYCGNNQNYLNTHPDYRLGTRYECLQKGIGQGKYNMTSIQPDPNYSSINNVKYYCGKSNVLPDGYNDFATNTMCLQKGIIIGRLNNSNIKTPFYKKWSFYIGLILLLILIILLIMIIRKNK